MTRIAEVFGFAMAAPSDVTGLAAAIAAGALRPADAVCVYVKSEGNGQDNDFSRDVAVRALQDLFGAHQAAPLLIASGGCEGVLSPHCTVIQRRTVDGTATNGTKALAVGHARSRTLLPEEIGTLAQAQAMAETVRAAMADAGLVPEDVAFVQVKAPLLTDAAIADAARRGVAVRAPRPHASKPLTRAACAIGVGLALGEIDAAALAEESLGDATDANLRTARAIVTPGNADLRIDAVAFGHAAGWAGPHRVGTATMADLIDLPAAAALLQRLGFAPAPQLSRDQAARIDAVLFKGDPPPEETIRGSRHVIWRDSDIQPPRHVRAAVGGLLAGLVGHTRIFCAGGAEHQAPPGGGVLAIFAREESSHA
ncbi:MAG: ring-opening amidohydrolase [Reyranellaceae bacterium]